MSILLTMMARDVLKLGRVHDAARDDFDPTLRIDDNSDGLDGGHAGDRRADQIRRAGRVDDVDALSKMIAMKQR